TRPSGPNRLTVTISLRGLFCGGLAAAVCVGLFLLWLWRPERQIKRHTENLFHAIEHKDWTAAASFIADDYHDQWGDDRARVLERMREGFRYVGGFHLAGRLLAQQNGAKLVGLIIARDKFFLRVASAAINAGGEHAEVADKIHPQIEHLRPEVRDLLVADAFLARHIRAGDKALVASVVPMRLTPHPAHDPIWIKCQVANCINPLFFCFEIFSDRRSMRAGQWRVAN